MQVAMGQALPKISLDTEYSNQFGLVLNTKYANLINSNNALATEVAFGGNEFRLGLTLARRITYRQLIKLDAEYLSQNMLFNFPQGSRTLWNEQPSWAVGYVYLLRERVFLNLNASVYGARSRDESFPLIINEVVPRDQKVNGSQSYGGKIAMALQPWQQSKLDFSLYYDTIAYRNQRQGAPDRSGLGAGIRLQQALHPRFALGFDVFHRALYNQIAAQASWILFAKNNSRLELGLKGEYLTGDLPQPKETRVGLLLSYRWNLAPPNQGNCLQEEILQAAMQPLNRMPQVFVWK